jgi:hypothetical protein
MTPFTLRALLPLTLACAACTAAAEVRLGLQTSALFDTSGGRPAAELLGSVSLQGPLGRAGGLQLRGTLSGGAQFVTGAAVRAVPLLRLDAALIQSGGSLYYGGGFGSGLLFDFSDPGSGLPAIVLSPVALLNVHAIIGKDFGGYALEGMVRAGYLSGISVKATFPLR